MKFLKMMWDWFTYDPRIEYLRQRESEGVSSEELWNLAMSMDV